MQSSLVQQALGGLAFAVTFLRTPFFVLASSPTSCKAFPKSGSGQRSDGSLGFLLELAARLKFFFSSLPATAELVMSPRGTSRYPLRDEPLYFGILMPFACCVASYPSV